MAWDTLDLCPKCLGTLRAWVLCPKCLGTLQSWVPNVSGPKCPGSEASSKHLFTKCNYRHQLCAAWGRARVPNILFGLGAHHHHRHHLMCSSSHEHATICLQNSASHGITSSMSLLNVHSARHKVKLIHNVIVDSKTFWCWWSHAPDAIKLNVAPQGLPWSVYRAAAAWWMSGSGSRL